MLNAWDAVSTLDRMFDDVMGSAFGTATSTRTFEPAIDVRVSESEVVFVCDVPGVKEEDLEVTLENHVLTIKGTRRFESFERQEREEREAREAREQVMLGRSYGSFHRAFTLPESLDEDNLAANLADGVLTIRISKHPKAMPRKIQIGSGSGAQTAAKQLKE